MGRRKHSGGHHGESRALLGIGLFLVGCLSADVDSERVPIRPRGASDAPLRSPSPAKAARCDEGVTWGLRPAAGMRIDRVHAYQGVEVPLVVSGQAAQGRGVELVQGRDLFVRVFVGASDRTSQRERRAHLILAAEGKEPVVFEDVRSLRRSSRQDDLESTFNFYVPGSEFWGVEGLAVELWENGSCTLAEREAEPNRVPAQGSIALRVRATGPVRVRIVPVRFDSDGSGRLPDVSDEHMEELSALLASVFPVSHVELSVRTPVATTETELTDILNQLLQLRFLEDPPSDVSYYGLVDPAVNMEEYCKSGCMAGVAAFGRASGSGAAGVGIGFRGAAVQTFVHEIGHVYRLMHAPCGGPSGVDPSFPYEGATLGSWGYDARLGSLIDPLGGCRDFMSYCDPTWISDYNYQTLVDRLSVVNGLKRPDRFPSRPEMLREWSASSAGVVIATPFTTEWPARDGAVAAASASAQLSATALVTETPPSEEAGAFDVYRTLHVDREGKSRWGVPLSARTEPGDRVQAAILDVQGASIGWIDVFRLELSEGLGALYFVPEPEAGWYAVAIEENAPQPFEASSKRRPFVP